MTDGPQRSLLQAKAQVERDRQVRNYERSNAGKSEHKCKLACLTHPPLTLVSKQIREESLAVFYEVNHFHFEMGNFMIRRNRKGARLSGDPSPVDWWRTVGGTDLRSIAKLSLLSHPQFGNDRGVELDDFANARRGVILTFDKLKNSITVENKETEYLKESSKAEVWDSLPDTKKDPQAGLNDLLLEMRQEGCSVRILESILDRLEPKRGDYLIDNSVVSPTPALQYNGIEQMAWVAK